MTNTINTNYTWDNMDTNQTAGTVSVSTTDIPKYDTPAPSIYPYVINKTSIEKVVYVRKQDKRKISKVK
jgi:hypothetical protein